MENNTTDTLANLANALAILAQVCSMTARFAGRFVQLPKDPQRAAFLRGVYGVR